MSEPKSVRFSAALLRPAQPGNATWRFLRVPPAASKQLPSRGMVSVTGTLDGQAFKATLEEVLHADLLLHVIDASSPTLEREIRTTEQVLGTLGAEEKPRLRVFNKIDQNVDHSVYEAFGYGQDSHSSVAISAFACASTAL
jgi:predicted GTPase